MDDLNPHADRISFSSWR